MKKYIGTKMIEAKPMNRGDYNTYRGWTIPEDENPADEGYLVKYSDGYESWSPKKQFEETYRNCMGMTFGIALELLKKGCKVAREGWNGKGMYLYLADGKLLTQEIGDGSYPFTDSIVMKTADNRFCIGWLASQTDMLAEDWCIVQ